MIKKHLIFRFIFLCLCYIPLGMLMFIGKPDRLQGILFDIHNFYGLKDFTLHLFIFGTVLVGIEMIWLLIKNKKNKYPSNILLLLFFVPLGLYSLSNDVFYQKDGLMPTQVNQPTVLVATEGSVYNFNLQEKKVSWKYDSPLDKSGNRNFFVVDGQYIIMPFESGRLINFEVTTGKIIWEQQIYGRDREITDSYENTTDAIAHLKPLFMSKPLVDGEHIVIASHGQPKTTLPFLYCFQKNTGNIIWKERLPSHFNIHAPLKFKGEDFNYYFVNSAIYLKKYGANTGSRYSYGMFDDHQENYFKTPIYNQMQTDGKSIFIGDEKGRFYCLPLDKNAYVFHADIRDPNNTFIKNTAVFKWIYQDDTFNFINNTITFLEDKVLFAEAKNGTADRSSLIAINTTNGTVHWKKVLTAKIVNWTLLADKIVGYTPNTLFYMDSSGQNFVEFTIEHKPISNIEQIDSSHLIYCTQQGIEILDLNTKTVTLAVKQVFDDIHHNTVQIRYISN